MGRTIWRESNYHETEFPHSAFMGNLIAVELRKFEVKVMWVCKFCLYEFHHEYILLMYCDKRKIMTLTRTVLYRVFQTSWPNFKSTFHSLHAKSHINMGLETLSFQVINI